MRIEVSLCDLPEGVISALAERDAGLPAEPADGDPDQALWAQHARRTGAQRRRAERRLRVALEVERLVAGGASRSQAVEQAAQNAGQTARAVWRWLERVRGVAQANWLPALADTSPAGPPAVEPAWSRALLKLWRRPQQPSLADALARLPAELPEGIQPPSYGTARRYLAKMSSIERARGRRGPSALLGVKAYVRRSVAELLPTDLYAADGHRADFELAHPRTGKPCRPEITIIVDARTRLWVGWSVALAESTFAVADALRHACTTHGIPALLYSDNGPGYRNSVVSAMTERLGIEQTHSIPRRSQSRGIVERANQFLIRAAKRLPTYMGDVVDSDWRRLVFQRTRRELREVGSSPLLMSWDDFKRWVDDLQAEYNSTPHRSAELIKIHGAPIAPAEAWRRDLEASGFVPQLPAPEEADDLFRPYELRVCRRGMIAMHSQSYFCKALEHYDGREVLAGYDIHDPSRIWVRDLDERLLAIAEIDANLTPFFPTSRVEQAREKRARRRERGLIAKVNDVRAELVHGPGAPIAEQRPLQPAPGVASALRRARWRPAEPESYILAKIVAAGLAGITMAALARVGAQRFPQDVREAAAQALAARGLIRIERAPHAGAKRPVTTYFATAAGGAGMQEASDAATPADGGGAQRRAPEATVVKLRSRPSAAAPEALPYDVIEYLGNEDDAFFARARWLERRVAAGETLDPAETRWLQIAQGLVPQLGDDVCLEVAGRAGGRLMAAKIISHDREGGFKWYSRRRSSTFWPARPSCPWRSTASTSASWWQLCSRSACC